MKYFVKVDTEYCGTDDYYVVFTDTEDKAQDIASNLAYENAISSGFIFVEPDELEGMDGTYISDEQISYTLEEYNPEEHDQFF